MESIPFGNQSNLLSFLVKRACKNPKLANYLYWYLLIEVESGQGSNKQDDNIRSMYIAVLKIFVHTLTTGNGVKFFFPIK